jgi:hypothetical protein
MNGISQWLLLFFYDWGVDVVGGAFSRRDLVCLVSVSFCVRF